MIEAADNNENKDEPNQRIVRAPRIMRPPKSPALPTREETVGRLLSRGLRLHDRLHDALEEGEAAMDTPEEKLAFTLPALGPLVNHGKHLVQCVNTGHKLARDQEERDRRNTA